MSGEQIVNQRPDLIEVKLCRGMRVHHCRVIDSRRILLQNGFNGQLLHVNVRLHERGEVGWDSSDSNGLDSIFIHETRNLNTAAGRQVIDQILIYDVSVDHSRNAGFKAVDNQRSELDAAPNFKRPIGIFQVGSQLFPFSYLRFATSRVPLGRIDGAKHIPQRL